MTHLLFIGIFFLLLLALYFTVLAIRMPKVHKQIESLHGEFKAFRKRLFNEVRPIFCKSESDFDALKAKNKEIMEKCKNQEKRIPHAKMVWLSPFVKNPETFIKGSLKDFIDYMRSYESKDEPPPTETQ
jgi:hypothetical protein